ncbi:hypothetical protein [Devosia sp. Root105]|uniref:hypothetical protein n=1 Tax=Devosia sp. Root105 TaxID=1736423 RepID=UPI0006F97F2F|nr:hypothetical protein [Devosia sp. Root105]KQU96467.1 hypothetical protein ASC68_13900 [Devosia sp. Root105]
MAKTKRPPEQKKNSFEDDDMRQLIGEIETLESEKVSIRAKTAGECGGISKKIGNAKGRAKELGIPLAILNGLLKTRKLERQIAAAGQGIPDDLAELWEEASGQFSFLAPDEEEPEEPGETAAQRAARQRRAEADAHHEAEQAEGEAALKDLVN